VQSIRQENGGKSNGGKSGATALFNVAFIHSEVEYSTVLMTASVSPDLGAFGCVPFPLLWHSHRYAQVRQLSHRTNFLSSLHVDFDSG